ncbi:hypothetical protein [Nocardia alni]|uniref:hypothetical protein n=1 Tax=Nocardia alni TaxID=2815723 RepID=UPI001C2415E5|nr:hypothetical protein [Nocardia alni]
MQPQSIYWTAIVGDNWPVIGPAEWGALEAVVRDGSGALDVDGLEQARRDFESRVRASQSLQLIKDDMLVQQGNSRDLANMLTAAAELLRDFAELAHRTRNQILDVVDRATDSITRIHPGLVAEPRAVQAYRIVAAARDEVADVVSSALHVADVPWSRAQAEIAEPLGSTAPAPSSLAGDSPDSRAPMTTDEPGDSAAAVPVDSPDTSEYADATADSDPFLWPMAFAPQEEPPMTAGTRSGPDQRPEVSAGREEAASNGEADHSARSDPAADARSAVRAPDEDRVSSGPAVVHNAEKEHSSAEMIRTVVGGAMAAAATPAFEVGGVRVDGDLMLARTILGGILSAVESSWSGVGYAVSVMRHPGGVRAFVASNEGRGWLPPGLYLPRATSTPARWAAANYAAWEGISDPARVLAEFGLAWGAQSGARLSALVSSQRIEPDMRRQLGEIPMEGRVAASSAMPLTAPGPGLVDRLGLVGSPRLVDRVERVPAHLIGASCVELAWDAHDRVGQLASSSAETLGVPALRERVLTAVRGGREAPAQWWDELRDIDDLLAATILARRADVSGVPLGELRSSRSNPELTALRAMVFQRRCDELTLMLALPLDRQLLRDAIYAHGQIVDHPVLTTAPPVSTAFPADPARAPA